MADNIDDLFDYEDNETSQDISAKKDKKKKGHYVGVHALSFKEFLLKPELNRAIQNSGFEHPSQVQQECIPIALLGKDIICQGKSGMGKTAVFVISVLQQLDPVPGEVSCLVLAPTRDLAYQICREFQRFSKFMPNVSTCALMGGIPREQNVQTLKDTKPNIIVSTPGRLKDLVESRDVDVSKVRFFIVDEADQVFADDDFDPKSKRSKGRMRSQVDYVFNRLPKTKQVMLLSATMSAKNKEICQSYAPSAAEVLVDEDKNLTLHGIQQYYVNLTEKEKNAKLVEILENQKYNQVVIFVKSRERADLLTKLLNECNLPSVHFSSSLSQAERIRILNEFKDFKHRILVTTNVTARGIDVERVNIVINYDMPECADTYLHRVGRAGRFGTKGLAVSFVTTSEDKVIYEQIQDRFEVKIEELTKTIDAETYMNA